MSHGHSQFAVLAFAGATALAVSAEAVVLQIDGTLIPKGSAIQPGLNKGENGCPDPGNSSTCYNVTTTPPSTGGAGPKGPIDPVYDAGTQPEVFLVPKDDDGHFGVVTFIDLLEGAGFENTFGWYNVGDDLSDLSNLHSVLTTTPINYEATPNTHSRVAVDFETERSAGRYQGGFIGFFLVTPEGSAAGDNLGNPGDPDQVGRIYYTERTINGDGNYVHYLIYQTKVTDAEGVPLDDYYFGFEDLYRGGDNDFEDMLILVRGLVMPCEPSSEVCDGRDNNCDGLIDNDPVDSGGPCVELADNTGLGECHAGVLTCASTGPDDTTQECVGEAGPSEERCNGLDDDCDGDVDNPLGGVFDPPLADACDPIYSNPPCSAETACVDGEVTCVISRGPRSETCNGIDDDCDGLTDNDPDDVGASCTDEPGDPVVGECHAGQTICDDGELVCQDYQGPEDEICDNKDNDCDGDVDEPGGMVDVGQSCTPNGVDVCAPGQTQCVGGVLTCTGFTTGRPETCNGIDDDCDGVIDDAPLDVGGPCGDNRGECEPGRWQCVPTDAGDPTSNELTCVGGKSPTEEQCDGKDNDCDGHVDSPGPMPGEGVACSNGCGTGVYQCQRGKLRCSASGEGSREVCNGIDDDCDGDVDEPEDLAEVGIACFEDDIQLFPPCQPGMTQCVAHDDGTATIECVGATQGSAEICDGVDNDCDGKVDGPGLMPGEGTACTTSCGPGLERCRDGELVCEAAGTREVCNGVDDDCDGKTDEASDLSNVGITCFKDDEQLFPPCKAGKTECVAQKGGGASIECVGATQGSAEVCDGIDNDCDGQIDGPGAMPGEGDACTTECGPGEKRCRSGKLHCELVGPGATESCNGLDDDCDGEVDEVSDLPEVGIACFPGGVELFPPCQAGTTVCVPQKGGGAQVECVGAVEGSAEVCDGIDNDCNGIIDDGTFEEAGQPCLTETLEELFRDVPEDEPLPGECRRGVLACIQTTGDDGEVVAQIGCIDAVEPTEEICDGLDNDCDGTSDSPDPCPGASECIAGQCGEPCTVMGEFVLCPGGLECVEGWCVEPRDAGAGAADDVPGIGAGGSSAGPGEDSLQGGSEAAGGNGEPTSVEAGGPASETHEEDRRKHSWADSDGDGQPDAYGLSSGGGGCSVQHAPRGGMAGALLVLLAMAMSLTRRRHQGSRGAEVVS
ncbi:MAG: DUF4114 domain-containing protein [Polyangiaceae bacterium]|nr:DUF4114 domain-containing protein [Polyangiaceae bacterium]